MDHADLRGFDQRLADHLDEVQTLGEAVGARGAMPVDKAAKLIEIIGEALIEAAQVGVVHRDLAPKNIVFAGDDVKLINFSLPVPGDKVPGVPEFVAPEQHEGKPVDQRSNLYSLGALYYYVLTGQPPQAENGAIRPPSQLAAVPPPVEAVIVRALDRSPTKRFLTVRQFVDEVSRVARGESADLKSTQAMGRAGKPKAELVQTLLGMRSGGAPAPIAASPSSPVGPPSTVVGMVAPTVPPRAGPAPPIAPAAMAPSIPTRPGTAPPIAPAAMAPPPNPSPALPTAPAHSANPAPSPWAPPSAQPPAPTMMPQAPAPPVMPQAPTPPVMPQPAPPVMPAAPVVATAAASGKKTGEPEAKGKFRETMWFKKGDLDAQAAQAAADERARTGKEVGADKADSLPIDERYKDDGSISRSDKEKYSLRTGATMMMSTIKDPAGASQSLNKVDEDVLVGEMKKGRTWVILAILGAVVAIGLIIAMIAR